MRAVYGNYGEDGFTASYDHRLMIRLLSYARPYAGAVAACVLILLLLTGVEVAIPLLSRAAIDGYMVPGPPGSRRVMDLDALDRTDRRAILSTAAAYPGLCSRKGNLLSVDVRLFEKLQPGRRALFRKADLAGVSRLAVLMICLLVLQALFAVVHLYWVTRVAQSAMYDLRQELFAHYQRLSLAFFDRNPVGRLVTRLANDVNVIQEFFTSVLVTLFKDLFILAGVVGVMIYVDRSMALAAFIVIPPLAAGTLVFRRRVRDAWRDIRMYLARINSFMSEHFSGIRLVQLFDAQRNVLADFDGNNELYFGAACRQIRIFALYRPFIGFLAGSGLAVVYWYGSGRVLDGGMSFGTLVAFVYYLEMFFRPVRDLSEKYNIIQAAMASAERIFTLLDTKCFVRVACCEDISPKPSKGLIEFDRVWFAYNDEEWVLKDLSFTVRPGESLALVGHTGAGKTSVINLLMRLYEFQKGSIRIDGRDIRDYDPKVLRGFLGCVRQDVFIFSGSVADNIRLLSAGISDDEVERAAEFVNAHRFIESLPGKYHTQVQERGRILSAGQRQLLSFARALAHRPGVLLLDEATSSVDTKTEQQIQLAMRKLIEDFTSVVVAHRLSTVKDADSIIVLHHGRIREKGTHNDLLANRDVYWRLYRMAAARS